MTTTTFLATVKSLPLVVLFVCLARASVLPLSDLDEPNQANLETIAQFRQEIVDYNANLRWIIRVNGKDVVASGKNRATIRVLNVAATAYWMASSYWDYLGNLQERYRSFYGLFQKFKLLPPLEIDKANADDILKMDKEFHEESCPLYKYYESVRDVEVEKKIYAFTSSSNQAEQVMQLANYFVPLARKIISDYDGAISYITREYERLCIDPQGIVHQYPKYYLLLWWSTFKFRNDVKHWNAFMATACPIVPFTVNGHDAQIEDMQGEDYVNMELKQMEIPEQVAELWKQLEMLKDKKTSMDLLDFLLNSSIYYNNMPDSERQQHDDSVWKGLQKKLIVQQTVLSVMDNHLQEATSLLDDKKGKLQSWLRARTSSSGQIPDLITAAVHQVLSTSEHYRKSTTKSNDILALVLKLAYGKENVHLKPNSLEQPLPEGFRNDLEKQIKIDKVRIFFPQESKELIAHSDLTDRLVQVLEESQFDNYDQFCVRPKNEQNMIMAYVVFALDEDIMQLTVPETTNTTESSDEPSQSWCSIKYCIRGLVITISLGLVMALGYLIWHFGNDTVTDISPSTNSTTDPSIIPQLSDKIWLWIIIVMVILALGAAAFYLIRRHYYRSLKTKKKSNKRSQSSELYSSAPSSSSSIVASLCSSSNVDSQVSSVSSVVSSAAFSSVAKRTTPKVSPSRIRDSLIPTSPKQIRASSPKSSRATKIGSPSKKRVVRALKPTKSPSPGRAPITPTRKSPISGVSKARSKVARNSSYFTITSAVTPSTISTVPVAKKTINSPKKKASSLTFNPRAAESPKADGSMVGGKTPINGVSISGSKDARNSSYFTLTSAVTPSTFSTVPVAKKTINSPTIKNSNMKGPSHSAPLPSRVKAPIGKVQQSTTGQDATTKPGGGDPKGVHKKKK